MVLYCVSTQRHWSATIRSIDNVPSSVCITNGKNPRGLRTRAVSPNFHTLNYLNFPKWHKHSRLPTRKKIQFGPPGKFQPGYEPWRQLHWNIRQRADWSHEHKCCTQVDPLLSITRACLSPQPLPSQLQSPNKITPRYNEDVFSDKFNDFWRTQEHITQSRTCEEQNLDETTE